jgi:hypothetical protein
MTIFKKSTRPGKKYMAKVGDRWVHFGALGYQHYYDKIGLYHELDHLDKDRRKRYRERHRKIMVGSTPAYKIKNSPSWFSWHYLW